MSSLIKIRFKQKYKTDIQEKWHFTCRQYTKYSIITLRKLYNEKNKFDNRFLIFKLKKRKILFCHTVDTIEILNNYIPYELILLYKVEEKDIADLFEINFMLNKNIRKQFNQLYIGHHYRWPLTISQVEAQSSPHRNSSV